MNSIPKFRLPDAVDPPRANLVLGRRFTAEEIREGSNVYLECQTRANPPIQRLTWMHNVSWFLTRLLFHIGPRRWIWYEAAAAACPYIVTYQKKIKIVPFSRPRQGKVLGNSRNKENQDIILSNQTLVIRQIERHTAGNYTCVAANRLGESSSAPLHLHVKCKFFSSIFFFFFIYFLFRCAPLSEKCNKIPNGRFVIRHSRWSAQMRPFAAARSRWRWWCRATSRRRCAAKWSRTRTWSVSRGRCRTGGRRSCCREKCPPIWATRASSSTHRESTRTLASCSAGRWTTSGSRRSRADSKSSKKVGRRRTE